MCLESRLSKAKVRPRGPGDSLEAAEKAKANPHTKQGITHLEAAISEGKKKDDKAATKHAEEALTHLEAARK